MKVKDFEIDFVSGLIMCCFDSVQACNDEAHEGMIRECEDCGMEMILSNGTTGMMWRLYKRNRV